jgi:hypothetical protein
MVIKKVYILIQLYANFFDYSLGDFYPLSLFEINLGCGLRSWQKKRPSSILVLALALLG